MEDLWEVSSEWDRDVPVGDRWEDLTDHISHKIKDHIQPYIDMHYIYALAKAGKEERVRPKHVTLGHLLIDDHLAVYNVVD